MSATFVFARVHLQGLEGGAMAQVLRNCLSCVLTARIFLLFDL